MLIIGIDPGLKGALSVIPIYSFKSTQVFPLAKYGLNYIASFLSEVRNGDHPSIESSNRGFYKDSQIEVFLEEPSLPPSFPGSDFKFSPQAHRKLGRSLGQWEGICCALHIPVTLVHPLKWTKFIGVPKGGDKNPRKDLARNIFPFLSRIMKNGESTSVITHDVADSLLIALYGYLQYQRMEFIPNSVKENVNLKKGELKNERRTRTRTLPRCRSVARSH